jgi:(p)ppGpp synthase/HD superfamily hydrolase
MIYTPLTAKAMKMAYDAHAGQLDYCGVPYIFHPIHLAEQMTDEYSCAVALLHDVVEDTALTLEDIVREFPREVVEGVKCMTHLDGVDYCDYVRALRDNPIARAVKIADLNHNLDATRCRLAGFDKKRTEQWREKYKKAMEILLEE